MPRVRKEPNRYWSKEEKLRIINCVLVDGLSSQQVANDEDISGGMLRGWIKKYMQYGEAAYAPQCAGGAGLRRQSHQPPFP